MKEVSSINCEIVSLRSIALLEVILYGDKTLNDKSNHRILTETTSYIKNTQWFELTLFLISSIFNIFY